MNTGDWIQLGLLILVMLTAVLLIYSWVNWPLYISILLTLGVIIIIRLVFRRIQL